MVQTEELHALRRLVAQHRGRKLPGEREIAVLLKISRQRLRVLLAGLEAEGLIERRQGSGTYAVGGGNRTCLSEVVLLIDADLKLGDDPFFSLLVERLQRTLQASDIRCMVERVTSETAPRFVGQGILTVGLAGAEAACRLGPGAPPAVVLLVRENGTPSCRLSRLLADNHAAGQSAARLLVEQGCTELLYVGRRDLPASSERLEGSMEAANHAGIPLLIHDAPLNYRGGLAAGRALRNRDNNTGLVAANDWLAVGLRAGLGDTTIPLASFDGLPMTADPLLAIRSLALPLGAFVTDAVAELRRLVEDAAAPGRTVSYAFSWQTAQTAQASAV